MGELVNGSTTEPIKSMKNYTAEIVFKRGQISEDLHVAVRRVVLTDISGNELIQNVSRKQGQQSKRSRDY